MNTSDNQTKTGQSRSDVVVVRGGVATPQQIQRGVAEHVQVTGLTGFSVQSSPGKTIDELAAAGQFRNRQISITTVGELEDAGTALGFHVQVVPSPGHGFHCTVITPNPLPDNLALAKCFVRCPTHHYLREVKKCQFGFTQTSTTAKKAARSDSIPMVL